MNDQQKKLAIGGGIIGLAGVIGLMIFLFSGNSCNLTDEASDVSKVQLKDMNAIVKDDVAFKIDAVYKHKKVDDKTKDQFLALVTKTVAKKDNDITIAGDCFKEIVMGTKLDDKKTFSIDSLKLTLTHKSINDGKEMSCSIEDMASKNWSHGDKSQYVCDKPQELNCCELDTNNKCKSGTDKGQLLVRKLSFKTGAEPKDLQEKMDNQTTC